VASRLDEAVWDFAAGFGRLGQIRRGFRLEEHGGIACFRRGNRREFLVSAAPAERVAPALAKVARSHDVCLFLAGDDGLVASWKSQGYRQRYTEFLMQILLRGYRAPRSSRKVRRATSREELVAMSKAKGWGRKYEPGLLEDEDVHVLYVEDGGDVVAGANLALLRQRDAAYVEDMFTLKGRQRQGIGSDLMHHMLKLARREKLSRCTLVAFADARPFYAALSFETLSELKLLMKRG
jgi:GNAT superfamily N-acetyltransferase